MAHTIAQLRSTAALDAYVEANSSPEDPALQDVWDRTRTMTNDWVMMLGHVEGLLLSLLVHLAQARRVLEIGTYTGYSALAIARALPPGGTLVTCEIDPQYAKVAQGNFDASPYGQAIDLRVGPAVTTVRSLQGPFDLVFIDGSKMGYIDYYEAALPLLAGNGLMVVDNTLHRGLQPQDPADQLMILGIRRFNSHVSRDPRVEQVILSVGDGISLIRRVD